MKKIKLIAPILGAAATLGTAIPLASCGKTQETFVIATHNSNLYTRDEVMLGYEILESSRSCDFSIAINYVNIYGDANPYISNTTTGMIDGQILYEQSNTHPNGYTIDYEKSGVNKIVLNIPWENFNTKILSHSLSFYLDIEELDVDGSFDLDTWDETTAPFPGDTTFFSLKSDVKKPSSEDYYGFTFNLETFKQKLLQDKGVTLTNQPLQFVIFGIKNQERINVWADRFGTIWYGNNQQRLTGVLSNAVVTIYPPKGGWGDEPISFTYEFVESYTEQGVQAYMGIPQTQ